MARIFSGHTTSTYTLTANPTTVTSAGTIDVNSTSAYTPGILGIGSVAWTLQNLGTVESLGTGGFGVDLESGGFIMNGASGASSALIDGANRGIYILGTTGTVTNFATIEGIGSGAVGVQLDAGGSVVNKAGGTITGTDGSVYIQAGPGTVTNAGTIVGGVWLQSVGAVTNQAGGTINGNNPSGGYGVGLHAGGSLTNAGKISGLGVGVELDNGGTVTNETGGALSGLYAGIFLGFPGEVATAGGGRLTNQVGAAIIGNDGVIAGGRPATVVNAGSITGTTAGTATSHGIFFVFGDGIWFDGGGVLSNQVGGVITGVADGVESGGSGTSGTGVTVTNSGTITGSEGISISPADTGKNTITNSGTIIGTAGTAVQFGAGNDTLIVKPGAVFTGAVRGGGGVDTVIQSAAGTLKVTGFSAFETIRLANGGADSLTLTSVNFTGVSGNTITVFDGNSGNMVNALTLPATDKIVVHAGTGADTLKGGAGKDTFYAGGNTTMTGGAGANQFTFADIGTNRITDFGASASNELVLKNSGFNLGADEGLGTATPQHLAASVFTTGAFTTTSQRFAYNTTTGTLRYDKDGSGASFSASTVVVLTGHPSLSAGSAGNLFFTS
ncbi:MAG: hypothetical protein WA459_01885 [Stellaceae bacterium]